MSARPEKIKLKYEQTDNGYCRIYYRQQKSIFCFQLASRDNFEMLICSRDGEPSHPVDMTRYVIDRLPPLDEKIAHDFVQFLQSRGLTQSIVENPNIDLGDQPTVA